MVSRNGRGGRMCNTNELLRLGLSLATVPKRIYHCFYRGDTITTKQSEKVVEGLRLIGGKEKGKKK